MAANQWRNYATRLNGDGTETLLASDIPFTGTKLSHVLSGTNEDSMTVPVEQARLKSNDDFSLFTPWRTAIYHELNGQIRGAGIVTQAPTQDQTINLTCTGWVGYAKGIPYDLDKSYINADAFDIARDFWKHLQARSPRSNIGLKLDVNPTHSAVRLGTQPSSKWPIYYNGKSYAMLAEGRSFVYTWDSPSRARQFGMATRDYIASDPSIPTSSVFRNKTTGVLMQDTTANRTTLGLIPTGVPNGWEVFGVLSPTYTPSDDDANGTEAQPWGFSWYSDQDMGSKWDTLATDGKFDFYESHVRDGETLEHTLHIAPSIGRVRDDLRFVVGRNVIQVPEIEVDGDDYSDEIWVYGAGEGRNMIRASWQIPGSDRLYRPKVFTYKDIRTTIQAQKMAQQIGQAYSGDQDLTSLVVYNTPNAPLGSWGLGDTITPIGSKLGWAGKANIPVRILGYDLSPTDNDSATLTVVRADKVVDNG